MRERRRGWLYRNYSACWDLLKKSKSYIIFTIILFLFSIVVGFLMPIFFEKEILALIANLSRQIEGLNLYELMSFIFLNNSKTAFLSIILGIMLGVLPFITSLINGYLIGFVARHSINQGGVLILWRLLPHGIFEIPAIIISMAIGMRLGVNLIKTKKWRGYKKEIVNSLRLFLFIVVPLLIIAAVIEGVLIFYLR